MDAGVTTTATSTASFSSILDKPLSQLTEEDIPQLTRDDCRKFLKVKGMRRPSWNKSQAIQQVISLKALLERNEDSSVGALRKILVCPPPPPVPPQNVVAHVASNSCNSVKETVLGDDPLKTAPVVGMCCEGGDKDKTTLSPRSRCETNELGGQMTIFYCGKINVYGVPLAKARAIMHLADSPIDFTRDNLRNGNAALRSLLGHLQAAGDKNDVASTTMSSNSHTMQTEKMIEYQQPYMEKGNISSDSEKTWKKELDRERGRGEKGMG